MTMTSQTKAFFLAGGTVLAWSTVSTAFKLALGGMSPMQLIFVSMLTAGVFLSLTLLPREGREQVRALARRGVPVAVLLGFMLYVYYFVLFEAYDRLPAQIAQPVNNTWAIVLALLAARLFKQKLSLKELCFMFFAYSGVVIIAVGGEGVLGKPDPTGMILIIASTVLYAGYWLLNTHAALPARAALGLGFLSAALFSGLTLIVRGEGLPPLGSIPPAVYVGLFEMGVPFVLWGAALRLTTTVSRISSLPFLVPFLALFWISLVLREPIAWTTIAGLACIITGTFLQQREASRAQRGGD